MSEQVRNRECSNLRVSKWLASRAKKESRRIRDDYFRNECIGDEYVRNAYSCLGEEGSP